MHFDAQGPRIMIQSEASNREVKFIGRNESTLSFYLTQVFYLVFTVT